MEPKDKTTLDPFGWIAYLVYVVVGGLFVFGFAWSLAGAVETQNASACRGLQPEARDLPAPDFVVQDLQGNEVRPSDFRGKFVVVNFWATWCDPCITEWPQVHRLAERLEDHDDVVVLAVSIDKDPEAIGPFLESLSLSDTSVEVVWDPEQTLHQRFGTTNIPDTYFVNEQGRITDAFVNVRKWGMPEAYHCVLSRVGR